MCYYWNDLLVCWLCVVKFSAEILKLNKAMERKAEKHKKEMITLVSERNDKIVSLFDTMCSDCKIISNGMVRSIGDAAYRIFLGRR
jgi:hypothetical protein